MKESPAIGGTLRLTNLSWLVHTDMGSRGNTYPSSFYFKENSIIKNLSNLTLQIFLNLESTAVRKQITIGVLKCQKLQEDV